MKVYKIKVFHQTSAFVFPRYHESSIFTENISRAHRVATKIDSGVVWINTWLLRDLRIPFGGMKHSGIGREAGQHGLDEFLEVKSVGGWNN